MFDDIIGEKNYQLICCASCENGGIDTDCPLDKECFHEGDFRELEGFERFNPAYRYSKWRLRNENREY